MSNFSDSFCQASDRSPLLPTMTGSDITSPSEPPPSSESYINELKHTVSLAITHWRSSKQPAHTYMTLITRQSFLWTNKQTWIFQEKIRFLISQTQLRTMCWTGLDIWFLVIWPQGPWLLPVLNLKSIRERKLSIEWERYYTIGSFLLIVQDETTATG